MDAERRRHHPGQRGHGERDAVFTPSGTPSARSACPATIDGKVARAARCGDRRRWRRLRRRLPAGPDRRVPAGTETRARRRDRADVGHARLGQQPADPALRRRSRQRRQRVCRRFGQRARAGVHVDRRLQGDVRREARPAAATSSSCGASRSARTATSTPPTCGASTSTGSRVPRRRAAQVFGGSFRPMATSTSRPAMTFDCGGQPVRRRQRQPAHPAVLPGGERRRLHFAHDVGRPRLGQRRPERIQLAARHHVRAGNEHAVGRGHEEQPAARVHDRRRVDGRRSWDRQRPCTGRRGSTASTGS